MDRSLPVHLWVSALIRRATLGGAFTTVVRHGDNDRGDVLVKVALPQRRASLYAPAFNPEGPPSFEALTSDGGEAEEVVDAMIERRGRQYRDLWVVEIEDTAGRHCLVERVAPKQS